MFVKNRLNFIVRKFCSETETGPLQGPVFNREEILSLPFGERIAYLERQLIGWIAKLLHLDPTRLSGKECLLHLGLDSIRSIELQHLLQIELNADVSSPVLLERSTIADLAQAVLQRLETEYRFSPLAAMESNTPFPLSHGQRALWFVHQMPLGNNAYNLGVAARIHSLPETSVLIKCFQALTDRHASLRTSIRMQKDEPIQFVHPECGVDFLETFLQETSLEEIRARLSQEAHEPFALENAP